MADNKAKTMRPATATTNGRAAPTTTKQQCEKILLIDDGKPAAAVAALSPSPVNNNNSVEHFKFLSALNTSNATPEKPIACKWSVDAKAAGTPSPHSKVDWKQTERILPDILKAIGNTHLVKLNKIPQSYGLKCDVYVKCEYLNPGGSVKDRIGVRMVEDAERDGILTPGSTIIEPSSGNTGIGIALCAAVKGYRCIIVMSAKMSMEKENTLRALGAEVVRTPISADSHSPDGVFGVSHRLKTEIDNSVILDQYSNPGNSLAHYDTTAEEIFHDCDGKIDMIVVGAGTGGTITGIARKIKELSPNTVIVGVDPIGSVMAAPSDLNDDGAGLYYEVEGVGYDFIPTSLDQRVVDRWFKSNDKDSFRMARRLIKDEGLLCGGSSGTNVEAAMHVAQDLIEGQRVVVILPDSIRNYLTKFVCDAWMEARDFKQAENVHKHRWWDLNVTVLNCMVEQPLVCVTPTMTCHRVLHLMKKQGIDQVPVVNDKNSVVAMVTMQKLLNVLINKVCLPSDTIDKAFIATYPKVNVTATLGVVSRLLEIESYVLIVNKEDSDVEKPVGIVSTIDLLHFITDFDNKCNTCCQETN